MSKKMMNSKWADPWSSKWFTGFICVYEVFSVSTKRTPALTEIMHKRPWLKPLFVGTLAWHLLNEKE